MELFHPVGNCNLPARLVLETEAKRPFQPSFLKNMRQKFLGFVRRITNYSIANVPGMMGLIRNFWEICHDLSNTVEVKEMDEMREAITEIIFMTSGCQFIFSSKIRCIKIRILATNPNIK